MLAFICYTLIWGQYTVMEEQIRSWSDLFGARGMWIWHLIMVMFLTWFLIFLCYWVLQMSARMEKWLICVWELWELWHHTTTLKQELVKQDWARTLQLLSRTGMELFMKAFWAGSFTRYCIFSFLRITGNVGFEFVFAHTQALSWQIINHADFPSACLDLQFEISLCNLSPDLVSGAADALLPLLLCEQGQYQVFSLSFWFCTY